MKKFIAMLLCLIMVLSLAPMCFADDYVNEDITGDVMIYTSMYQFVIDMMDAKLEEVFPNCNIEFFYGGTGSLQTKLAGEMETGTLGCDMMLVAEPAYSLELKEGGWLHSFEVEDPMNFSALTMMKTDTGTPSAYATWFLHTIPSFTLPTNCPRPSMISRMMNPSRAKSPWAIL